MSLKVAVILCLVVVSLADKHGGFVPFYGPPPPPPPPPPPVYLPAPPPPPPVYLPAPPPPPPVYHHHPAPPPLSPPKYEYSYEVFDANENVDFGASEARDGYVTKGSYYVLLPDGRKQLVTYADNGDGLIAEVTYA